MNQVDIYNLNKYNIEESKILDLIMLVLKKEKKNNSNLNIIFVDNKMIQKLNNKYRNNDKVTDVLSFEIEDKNWPKVTDKHILGDIYISIPQAKKQAIEYQHSLFREVAFLTVHGVYHLLGYDHQDKNSEKIMFQKQEEVLEEYGIKR